MEDVKEIDLAKTYDFWFFLALAELSILFILEIFVSHYLVV